MPVMQKQNIGRRLETLEDLALAAAERKAVILTGCLGYAGCRGYQPAAWVMHYQGETLVHMLRKGIYLYERSEERAGSTETDNEAFDEEIATSARSRE